MWWDGTTHHEEKENDDVIDDDNDKDNITDGKCTNIKVDKLTVVQGQTSKPIRNWVNNQADNLESQRELQEAGILNSKLRKLIRTREALEILKWNCILVSLGFFKSRETEQLFCLDC